MTTAFGLLMVAASVIQATGPALWVAGLAVVAVLVGSQIRAVATVAVLSTLALLFLAAPSPVFAALSGVSAATYLTLRYAAPGPAGALTVSPPTIIAAAGFGCVGLVAAAASPQLPWLPLLAPLAVFGCYTLAIRPFLAPSRYRSPQ